MLQGLSNTCLSSTFGAEVAENFTPPLSTNLKWWNHGRIWSLWRPYHHQLNEFGHTSNETIVTHWIIEITCHDDNDAKGRDRLQCSRARCPPMAERDAHTQHIIMCHTSVHHLYRFLPSSFFTSYREALVKTEKWRIVINERFSPGSIYHFWQL